MPAGTSAGAGREASNAELFLPYIAPYLLYVGIASVPGEWLSPAMSYALRLLLVPPALYWAWSHYPPLLGPRTPLGSLGTGLAFGLLGTLIWVALLAPFVEPVDEPWSATAFALRTVAASSLVPLFEELLMRGYVLRFSLLWERAWRAGDDDPFGTAAHQRGPRDVAPGEWSWISLLASSAVFTLGHGQVEWLAALAYGLLMGWLWILRKDLLTCIAAHAATNASLAAYVLWSGRWELW